MKFRLMFCLLAAVGAMSDAALAQPAPVTAATAPAASAEVLANDYRLGPADKLRITVYGEETLTGEYSVSGSGVISFPLIGEVRAADRTLPQIREEIRAKLADGYLREPQVSAEVLTFRPFYILGEVNRPGQYPYTDGLTVPKAVATAGGFTYRANQRKVFIKRGDHPSEEAYELTPETMVAPGDMIRIGERFF
jgi:polysaccharide export outer membrane protein